MSSTSTRPNSLCTRRINKGLVMAMLTAQDVAERLHKPASWVYRNKEALGGFQPQKRGSILFSSAKIDQILRGEHAISNEEKREMEGTTHDRRETSVKIVHQKKGRPKVGVRTNVGGLGNTGCTGRDPFDLLAG
ncbi:MULTISPECIES: hypothetical protein [unclassified Maridesulfovibrio]|uniref:hypothetical protein n=1 Tax=unclassified Maridesulfovibrio TaxID=2794999 RepID=UPI003B41E816